MHLAPHEWRRPGASNAVSSLQQASPSTGYQHLYHQLADGLPDAAHRMVAAELLRGELENAASQPCELPEDPQDLQAWMQANTQTVHANHAMYLEQRKAGGPRRYFSNRAHALYFLRNVAPTKYVDGAWLYGLMPHARNPRFAELIRTYLEELGDGAADKNHVVLYRSLVARHNLDPLDDLPDAAYHQGLLQLALGWNAEEFLPEVIGFNLGYEQLPLHLLITAYELNELGIDPYYFTLHVTVDNADTGHAKRACQAVLDTLPRIDDGGDFWQRVREGSKLGCAGLGTVQVIEGFDIDAEVLHILAHKATVGNGAHSDYCHVAGRSVNDWLAAPQDLPAFLQALEQAGWLKRGEPVANSRFWNLLQGPRAEMFGVFSEYELQVLHDWIRGEASSDGQAVTEVPPPSGTRRRPTFRAAARSRTFVGSAQGQDDLLDPDLQRLQQRTAGAGPDEVADLLVQALSPGLHWTPAGLWATRQFMALA